MKFNKLIPEFTVTNIEKSKDFYINFLKFKLEYERIEDKFAFVSLDECQIMLQEKESIDKWDNSVLEYPFGRGINFQIDVDDIDLLYSNLKEKQYNIEIEMEINQYRENETLWTEKGILIRDLDGYLLRFSQTLE